MQLGRVARSSFKPPRLLDQRQEAPDRVAVLGRHWAGRHVELERRRRRACERRRRVVRIAAKEHLARPADRKSAGLPQVIRLGKVERRHHSRLARSKLFRPHLDLREAAEVGNLPALFIDDDQNLVMGGGGRLIISWLLSDVFNLKLHRDGIARSKALLLGGDPRAKPVVGIAPFGCGWRLSFIAALRGLRLFCGTRNGEPEHDQRESQERNRRRRLADHPKHGSLPPSESRRMDRRHLHDPTASPVAPWRYPPLRAPRRQCNRRGSLQPCYRRSIPSSTPPLYSLLRRSGRCSRQD